MIYQKIDWLTLIVEKDCPLNILKMLKLTDLVDDLIESAYSREMGYDTRRIFNFEGVCFDFSLDQIMDVVDDYEDGEKVFSQTYRKFRVDISGQGLDYLRSIGFDPEKFLFDLSNNFNPLHIRPSRIDYAFDFVNVCGDHLDLLLNEVKVAEITGLLSPGSRIKFINMRPGGTAYSYRFGNGQKTFYFGTPRSESLLRIYDKKLQFEVQKKPYPLFNEVISGQGVTSWIRWELQTRGRFCLNFFLENSYCDQVLGYIKDNYLAINPCTLEVFEGIKNLFRELDEMKIGNNGHYPIFKYKVLHEPFVFRRDRAMKKSLKWWHSFRIRYGLIGIRKFLDEDFEHLVSSNEPREINRRRSLCLALNEERFEDNAVFAMPELISRLK